MRLSHRLSAIWLLVVIVAAAAAQVDISITSAQPLQQDQHALNSKPSTSPLVDVSSPANNVIYDPPPQRPFSSQSSDATRDEEAYDAVEQDAAMKETSSEEMSKEDEGWVYLIRHGEKFRDTDKVGLSERGVRRAKCLSHIFSKDGREKTLRIDYILAQDFKTNGQKRRPYETVKPLAKKHDIKLNHSCDRDDTKCAARKIRKRAARGENVLVVWEHKRLTQIAKALGVKGLMYPSERYDVVFKLRGNKVHSIYSEGCPDLDDKWLHWKDKRRGKHGKSPHGGRMIDDESWASKPET